jgi:hypothetical protein
VEVAAGMDGVRPGVAVFVIIVNGVGAGELSWQALRTSARLRTVRNREEIILRFISSLAFSEIPCDP